MTMRVRPEMPTAENSHNFSVATGSTTAVGTTLENLKAAVCGETGASAKYAAFAAAQGEIYETSDMYPAFIQKAQEEGDKAAVMVFTRAKLAESVHAERYLEAYNNVDAEDDGEEYYLCPFCGYIHKGSDFEKCPICFAPKDKFKAY